MEGAVSGTAASIVGERILERARTLAFPRYPGTEDNLRARDLVARALGEAGLDVRVEAFSYDVRVAFRAIRIVLVSAAALVAVAGLAALRSAAGGLVALGLGCIVGGVMLVWAPGAERLYRRPGPTTTWNVEGRRRTAGKARATLVLLAHYDSKSQNLSFPYRMGATLLAIGGALTLAAVLVLRVAGFAAGPAWLAPALAGVAAVALLVLSTLRNGNASPGGVDNAGSVGILLELARALPREVPDDVELVFLSTGAEEDHMIGAMRWLDAHRDELTTRPTAAINFDGAGAPGRPVMLESYGFGHRFAPGLARLALEASRRAGANVRRVWLPPAMGIDAIPFHHRGIPCLTLSSGSLGPATIAVHSARDVADHLDAGTLATVAALGRDVALGFARSA